MSARLRELWKAELARRAEAALLPGEGPDVARRAVELAVAETPDPPPHEVRPLLYGLGPLGELLRALDKQVKKLPADEDDCLFLE
jgi:hypothetical protein